MTDKQQLDAILQKWDLLTHPFYKAWSAGTLPNEAFQLYASEYGRFIEMMPQGWETLDDLETADEEREHAEMWRDFSAALEAPAAAGLIPQTEELVRTAEVLFSQRPSALGALYAFEAQQPATAQSKLEGLRTHYRYPKTVEPYFEVHSSNWHESQKILARIQELSPAEQVEARLACEWMAQALWDALTGIQQAAGCES